MAWLQNLIHDYTGITLGPELDRTVNDWTNGNVFPGSFTGTLTDLNALINTQAQSCATYVIGQAPAFNKADAITACQARLQQLYSPVLQQLQGQQKKVQDSITSSIITNAAASKNTIVLFVFILALLILIFLYFI